MNRGWGAIGRYTRRFGLKNMILYIYIKSPIRMSGSGTNMKYKLRKMDVEENFNVKEKLTLKWTVGTLIFAWK